MGITVKQVQLQYFGGCGGGRVCLMLCLVARRAMLLLFAVMFMCTRQRQLLMLRWVSFVGTSTHRMLTVMARKKGGGG